MKVGLSQEYSSKIADSVYEPEQKQIGLLMGNIPEMPSFLLGIARVRASSVLFNINQKRDTLLNAFRATKCKIVIFDSRYLDSLREISDQLDGDISFVMWDRGDVDDNNNSQSDKNVQKFDYHGSTTAQLHLSQQNFARILPHYDALPSSKKYKYSLHDHIAYIFTSGTTGGAIKATPVDNIRFVVGFYSQSNAFGVNEHDNVYISLPLFHSFPCVIGLGRCLLGGSTITLTEKFSASRFWLDCVRHNCTVALYIGETCRYLLAQPVKQEEKQHRIRMMLGLGMRKEIWNEFVERFKIKKIAEFYGSSEGNINICEYILVCFDPET